jgi:serine/threonine protein kinase
MKEGLSPQEVQKERDLRRAFVHFLSGLLNPDPAERWTPDQARMHPFIKGEPFDGTFNPEPTTKSRHTQPRIIPWGIQNAALTQKPISMSYPEQMMDYDNFEPASYSPRGYVGSLQPPDTMLGSSPYGSSFGSSPYGSAPNAFMMQHMQQQQMQLKVT